MAVIRIGGFRGELPRIHPRLLPDGGAQTAINCRLDSGALEALRFDVVEQDTVLDQPISLFRYSSTVWLESQSDVDWVTYPIVGDQFGRVIFTDAAVDQVRVTDASIVGTGGYPAVYRELQVPPPTRGFQAALNGTADEESEVPETRYYVCTFVNEYGSEGPPSPASNQVEWRSGQTVTLSNLPAVPTGNYNITHRRIYRINTGSSGVTNYQFVTEIAVAQNLVNITDITQASPPVITTATPHGLSTGQEVVFSGLGLDATPLLIDDIEQSNPAQILVNNHSLTTGMTVEFSGLTAATGMQELNGNRYEITFVNSSRFSLVGVDSTGYTPYIGGGSVTRVYGMDELNGNKYFVVVDGASTFSLESVDASAFKAYADSGKVQQVSGTSYVDQVASGALGEVLPTELYDPPNPATKGLKTHPAGFLVGFFGKTLAFSEPGAPHAWPIDYRLVTNHDIVATGIFGNTVVVMTKGWPYLAVGSDPAAMTLVELEIEQACISKRGVVDFGTAVVYPSPDGLILVTSNGVENVTSAMFTREQWQQLAPSTLLGFNWEGKYLGFYQAGAVAQGFIIDPFDAMSGVRYVDDHMIGGFKDIEEDVIYTVDGNSIVKWDEGSAKRTYTWKSKPIYTPRPVNMAAAKVIADDYPVTTEFWVDDVKRHTRVVQSIAAFRLPGGFRGEKFEVVLEGTKRVSEVSMATTMTELAAVV